MPSQPNLTTVVVIAPDKLSGQIYFDEFKKKYPDSILVFAKVRPRILSTPNDININRDNHGVGQDIANNIQKYSLRGYRNFAVACNTAAYSHYAQYLQRILQWRKIKLTLVNSRNIDTLNSRTRHPDENFLLTNTSAIKIIFSSKDMPLFLGTYPLTQYLTRQKFNTLIKSKHDDLAKLVQQIIWHVKAIGGDDTSTSGISIDELLNPKIFDQRILQLGQSLQLLGHKTFIVGCTELPYAFKHLHRLMPNYHFKTIDPATLVSEIYKIITS